MAGEKTTYVLNGERLRQIEADIRQARDAAIRAEAAVERIETENKTWRKTVCNVHTEDLKKAIEVASDNRRRLDRDSKWPTIITVFTAQAVSTLGVWFAYFKFLKG